MARKRMYQYDFVRFVGLLMVIALHAHGRAGLSLDHAIFADLLITCNAIFFMLAGVLNIRVRDEVDTRRYYYHKMRNLLLPLVLYVVAMILVEERAQLGNPQHVVHEILRTLLTDERYSHLWFIRTAFGLLLAAPFFAYLVRDATEHDRRRFVAISLIYLAVRFVTSNLGFKTTWGFPWGVWAFCFCLAPLCLTNDAVSRIPTPRLVGGALAGWLVLVLLELGLGWQEQIRDANPIYVVESVCVYLLLMRLGNRVKPNRVVSAIARYQFPIYIVHMFVLQRVGRVVEPHLPPIPGVVVDSLLTVVVSYLGVLAFDKVVVRPAQALCDRIVRGRPA